MRKKKEKRLEKGRWSGNQADKLSLVLWDWDLEAWKVRSGRQGWKVKTYLGSRLINASPSQETLLFMHHVLEFLALKGFPYRLPRLIPTKYGDIFVSHEGKFFYLTDWFKGKRCREDHTDHVLAAVHLLAEFHKRARGFSGISSGPIRERWGDLPDRVDRYTRYVDNNLVYLPEEIGVAWEIFRDMAEKSREFLKSFGFRKLMAQAKEEGTICHRQFYPHNILIDDVPGILGWNHCAFGVQAADLVYFMHKVMPEHEWDFALGKRIVDTYCGIRSLTEEEIFVLGAALTFPLNFIKLVRKYLKGGIDRRKISRKISKIRDQEMVKAGFLEAFFENYGLKSLPVDFQHPSRLVSRMWYCLDQGKFLSGDFQPSCFLPLSYMPDAQGGLKGEISQILIEKARDRGIPVCPVVYAARWMNPGIASGILADIGMRKGLAEEIVRMVESGDFPGVNINFDLVSAVDKNNFNIFIEYLVQQMKARGRLTIVSVAPPKPQVMHYDYNFLGRVCDYVLVELLDENLHHAGPVASKNFIQVGLAFARTYIPAEKIVAVLPVYGYRWFLGKNIREVLAFEKAQELVLSAGGKLLSDTVSDSMYGKFSLEGEPQEIWAESAGSLNKKVILTGEFPVAGVAFWRLGLEDPDIWVDHPGSSLVPEEESWDEEEKGRDE